MPAVYDPEELASAEQAAKKPEASGPIQHEDPVGIGYTGSGANQPSRIKLKLTRRRTLVGGGIIGAIVAAVIFLFTLVSGPLQLIHLSQILSKNWQGQNDTAQVRLGRLMRFARTGDPGDLRVSRLGKAVVVRAINNLEAAGIKVLEKNIDGKPTKVLVNAAENPQLRNVPPSELKSALTKEYKMSANSIKARCCNGRTFELTFDPSKPGDLKSLQLIKAHNLRANSGRVTSSIMSRKLGSFWGIGTLYHPLERAKLAIKGKPAQITTERLKAQEVERRQKIYARNQGEVKTTSSKIKDSVKGKTAMSALLIQGTLCAVRSVAGDVVKLNHLAIVLPASAQAVDAMAVGAQIQSGQDFDAAQLGPIANGFKDDKGRTIWQGQALQVLAGNAKASGEDLPANYAQAFSDQTTASNIRNFIDSKLPLHAGVIICSPVGIGVGIVLAVGAIVASVESGGVSAQAYFALKTAAGLAATAGGLYLISSLLEDMIKEKAVVPEILSGPLGGNLMAYGARAASNTAAIAAGGAEIEGSETTAYDRKFEIESQKEFQTKKLAERLFNVHDYRSVASQIINKIGPDPVQNLAKAGSIFTNFGSTVSNIFSSILPHANAADKDYDWGFPRYGIPQNIAESPKYEDPYANAEMAVNLIKSDSGYKDRIEKCFGVEVNEDDGWNVVPDHEIDPNEESYTSSNCNEDSENWRKIQLFIFDSQLMDATACYEGDDAVCSELGFDSSEISDSQPETPGINGLIPPPNLGPQIGSTGYYRMPDATNGEHVFNGGTPPNERCGSKALVDAAYTVAAAWNKLYPNNKLAIGDMNADGHASHLNGVDVDIYSSDGSVANTSGDRQKSIALGRLWADTGIVSLIFYNDSAVQTDFNNYVSSKGLSGNMQYWPGHEDHFHVRILDKYRLSTSAGCPG